MKCFIKLTRNNIAEHEQLLNNKPNKKDKELHKLLLKHQREQLAGFNNMLKIEEREHYDKNPSLSQKLFGYGILLGLVLSVYGMWVDFTPSPTWFNWGGYLSAVCATGLAGFFCWGVCTGRVEMDKYNSKLSKFIAVLISPFIIFGFFWTFLVIGLADLVTLSTGDPHKETAALTKHYKSSQDSCDYQLRGVALERSFPSYVCISNSFYNHLPSSPVPITLEGKKTIFGFHIQNIKQN